MTSPNTFPTRFLEIDELTRREHFYITEEDDCYYLGEYTPREGYTYSKTNDTILNFKKSMDRLNTSEWKYKDRAINECATAFATALNAFNFRSLTFVPVPPSRIESDSLYDDRLVRMLNLVNQINGDVDVLECVQQVASLRPSHDSEDRPTPSEIAGVYKLRNQPSRPRPKEIAIVDDLLTTGAHFKAMKSILSNQYPEVKIVGLFLARREVPNFDPTSPFLPQL